MAKEYPGYKRSHGQPSVKSEDNKSGATRTSKAAMAEGKAKTRWDDKGQPTHGGSVTGSNWKYGTPGYIQAAASAAEKHAASRTGGAFSKPSSVNSHRENVPAYGGQGKPEVKKDKGYTNPMKETK